MPPRRMHTYLSPRNSFNRKTSQASHNFRTGYIPEPPPSITSVIHSVDYLENARMLPRLISRLAILEARAVGSKSVRRIKVQARKVPLKAVYEGMEHLDFTFARSRNRPGVVFFYNNQEIHKMTSKTTSMLLIGAGAKRLVFLCKVIAKDPESKAKINDIE
ncbi:hypothetical protein ARMGADRAFT_1040214 [Armillaria gallica]|uniref:Uncharacterized protein n=1 Tax=Armillaria gallica TaxID=47427 RepID=A0A2H3CLZ9_ARMGA|nr:hypothetical protein ARMGADRAFT_1040214 [Armillaria gallica]